MEDLIHEENIGLPILQVAVGRFIPSSPSQLALAGGPTILKFVYFFEIDFVMQNSSLLSVY